MKRSPMYASAALALGLTLALTLLWLLGGNLHTVRAATLTVTNTHDSGIGSLRQAILDANASSGLDTITITATGTISLSSSLDITESVVIIGPGAGLLAVDGNNAGRVISASADLSLSGLTIQNGNAIGTGGGIYAAAALTLTNVNVLSNTASSDGGGAYVAGAAALSGGRFENKATSTTGGLCASRTLA